MQLQWLSSLNHAEGRLVTVCLDASRLDETRGHDAELRWNAQERKLRAAGAPEPLLRVVGEAVLAPTEHGGAVAKLVVVSSQGVELDLVLPGAPVRDEATFGSAPHLLPLVRSLSQAASYVLARVDRAGADIEFAGLLGEPGEHTPVDGEHDVLHKVRGGGWSHQRYQARVEDSTQRNATEVAERLATIVRRHKPQLVLLAGDPQAVAALLQHATPELRSRLVELGTGGRAEGTSAEAERRAIEEAVSEFHRVRRQELLDRFRAALARQQEAVQGLDAVIDALRRGQVDELLLHDDPSSTKTLWVGSEPLQLATTAEEARAEGADSAQQERADAVLLGALLATDAGITLLNPLDADLVDGVGALLRWSDRSTPHTGAPSMPGHGEGPGQGHQ